MGDDFFLKKLNNSKSGGNSESKFVKEKTQNENTSEKFHVVSNPSAVSWDRTPDTAEELINTYGTYEIQATCATDNTFPAISQGLPSEKIKHKPSDFHEGIIPELNKLEKDKP